MKRTAILLLAAALPLLALQAQQVLTLDSCRALALRGNKAISMAKARQEKAAYDRKAAHTNYLPKVSLTASYLRTGDEISLLSDKQKHSLSSLGTSLTDGFKAASAEIVQKYPDLLPLIQGASGSIGQAGAAINGVGQGLVDALRTDTRNMAAGAVLLTQPLYMGGKIRAYDRITRYSEDIAAQQLRADEQQMVLETDQAYWQVVSLSYKKRLAESYLAMLSRLEDDVKKMYAEGVATRANELSVSVKRNEAEMTLTKVENGLALSRMLLCQLCGLPLDTDLRTADEMLSDLPAEAGRAEADVATAYAARPELSQLRTAKDIYAEKVNIERAAFLPQLALMGGYLATNPGVLNGFENRFRGTWGVGVTLKVPVWNWGEGRYKVRAAKAESLIAGYKLEEAQEKIELQVNQSAFHANEADKQLGLTLKNLEKAEENLRTATIGFKEGVIATSDVLAAQTAWLQAQSDKIDAQIDVKLSRAILLKALGTLR